MGEGLLKARIGEVVTEARIECIGLLAGPGGDLAGDVLQGGELSGRVAVPPGVIGNDGFAASEHCDEFVFHG